MNDLKLESTPHKHSSATLIASLRVCWVGSLLLLQIPEHDVVEPLKGAHSFKLQGQKEGKRLFNHFREHG